LDVKHEVHVPIRRDGKRAAALRFERRAVNSAVAQTVDFADRTDVDRVSPSSGIVDTHLDDWNGRTFVSDSLQKPTEFSGLFSGELHFRVNKKDLDFSIQLYELTAKGDQAGSRLVLVLSVVKQPDIEINYGTGKDVSDETVADAQEPLRIEWLSDSSINIPVMGGADAARE
jgi:uncharacterized protein